MKKSAVKSTKNACPVAAAATHIADMWTVLITRDLLIGPRRFCELQHSIVSSENKKEINSRTLTNRLKHLEREGFVTRTTFPHEMPPRVEYSLTKKGRDLSTIVEQLRKFGEKYLA